MTLVTSKDVSLLMTSKLTLNKLILLILTYDYLDTKTDTPGTCICGSNDFSDLQKQKCVCKYPNHPLNPKLQNH